MPSHVRINRGWLVDGLGHLVVAVAIGRVTPGVVGGDGVIALAADEYETDG